MPNIPQFKKKTYKYVLWRVKRDKKVLLGANQHNQKCNYAKSEKKCELHFISTLFSGRETFFLRSLLVLLLLQTQANVYGMDEIVKGTRLH